MTLRIISADEPQAEAHSVKVVVLGRNCVGKTSTLFASPLPSHLLLHAGKQDQGGNKG